MSTISPFTQTTAIPQFRILDAPEAPPETEPFAGQGVRGRFDGLADRDREMDLSRFNTELTARYAAAEEEARSASEQRMKALAKAERAAVQRVREMEALWEKGEAVRLSMAEEIILQQSLARLRAELEHRQTELKDTGELCLLVKNELTQAQRSQAALTEARLQHQKTLEADTHEAYATIARAKAELDAATQNTERTLSEARLHHQQTLEADTQEAEVTIARAKAELEAATRRAQEVEARETTAATRLKELETAATTAQAELAALQAQLQETLLLQDQARAALAEIPPPAKTEPAGATPPAPAGPADSEPLVSQESTPGILRELIKIVDFTDTAHSFLRMNSTCKVSGGQFKLLRQSLVTLLNHLGVDEITLSPGVLVDSTLRNRLLVLRHVKGTGPPRIQSLVASGFARSNPDQTTTFLRKPEVITTSALI